jgi:hypothetical protein
LDIVETMISHYNFPLQVREEFMLIGMVVGSCVSFFLGLFTPAAGPDWMWAGGREDMIRGLFFLPNGSFRRYGRPALFLTVATGAAAFAWLAAAR